MRTSRIIGQTVLNLAEYVDVKSTEITIVLQSDKTNRITLGEFGIYKEQQHQHLNTASTASGMEESKDVVDE